MIVQDKDITAQQAADRFAALAFNEIRHIARWLPGDRPKFKLVGGRKWYVVLPHACGWQVIEEGSLTVSRPAASRPIQPGN